MAVDPKLLVIKSVIDLDQVTGLQSGDLLFYDGSENLKRISVDTFNNLSKSAKPLGISDPSPTLEGIYKPKTTGTYSNAGGLEAQEGYDTLFFYNGTTWSKSEFKYPQATQSIPNFEDSTFPLIGTSSNPIQRTYNNALWQLNQGETSSITDVPGLSNKWVEIIRNYYDDNVSHIEELYNDVFDPSVYSYGQTNSTPSYYIVNQFEAISDIEFNKLLFNVFVNNDLVTNLEVYEVTSVNPSSLNANSRIYQQSDISPVASSFGNGYYEINLTSKVSLQAGKKYAFRIGNQTTSLNKSAMLQNYPGSTANLYNLGYTNNASLVVTYSTPYYLKPLLFKFEEDIITLGVNSRLEALENEIPTPSTPIKYDAMGDSITFGHPTNNAAYKSSIGNPSQINSYAKVASDILGLDFKNSGVSSSRLATDPNSSIVSMVDRLDQIRDDSDIVSIMGGTNDRAQGVPLGVFGDNISTTYYGALRIICETLINRFWITQNRPKVKIFFCTFPKSATSQNSNIAMDFSSQLAYREAILKTCDAFGLPVFDAWSEGNLSPHTMRNYSDGAGNLYNRYMPDGTHPSIEGHEVLGSRIASFIKNIL